MEPTRSPLRPNQIVRVSATSDPGAVGGALAHALRRSATVNVRELAYDLAVGNLSPDDLRAIVAAKAAEYDVSLTVDIDENADVEHKTLWVDA